VTQYKLALAAIALTISMTGSGIGQHARPTSDTTHAKETCAGCFAYLEFSDSPEPESYAMRGQVTETPASLPVADEPGNRQTAGLITAPNE